MVQINEIINLHKLLTPFVVLGLIHYYNQWNNTTAWVYFAIHGSYGIIWIIKDTMYGDKSFKVPAGFLEALFSFLGLDGYWLAPYNICSQSIEQPIWRITLLLCIFIFGFFLHYVSDMQKFQTLKLKKGLIQDGFFQYLRNPNYLGELMIYIAFVGLSNSIYAWLHLLVVVTTVFLPNMLKKDKSLSRYKEFAEWKKNTWMFIPFLF